MTIHPSTRISLTHLGRADGSASFSHAGYNVVATANGPIESSRRDENSAEAIVDVVLRPVTGVGGTRERYLETIIRSALRQLISVQDYPRLAIQVTLQMTAIPPDEYTNYKTSQLEPKLATVPILLHGALLALLSASVPLKGSVISTIIAISRQDGNQAVIVEPSPIEIARCESIHLLAFTASGDLLLCESEGQFSSREWEGIVKVARQACCQPQVQFGMSDFEGGGVPSREDAALLIRSALQEFTEEAFEWKMRSP